MGMEFMLAIGDMVSFILEPSDTCYQRSWMFGGSFPKCPSSVIPRPKLFPDRCGSLNSRLFILDL